MSDQTTQRVDRAKSLVRLTIDAEEKLRRSVATGKSSNDEVEVQLRGENVSNVSIDPEAFSIDEDTAGEIERAVAEALKAAQRKRVRKVQSALSSFS